MSLLSSTSIRGALRCSRSTLIQSQVSANRLFSQSMFRRSIADDLDISRAHDMPPERVLEIGFRRIKELPGYRKSEKELQPLISAAVKLGISADHVRELYEKAAVGGHKVALGSESGFEPGSIREEQALHQQINNAQLLENAHNVFEYDDIPALGHLQLRDHRVQREYNRIAAYELPQLTKFASEYRPPTSSQVLRFRYTSYLEEDHPGESKVVVTFKTNDLKDLNDKQRHKLRLLVGSRYNPDTDTVKISSASFPEATQNVRYIGELITKLLIEAKDLSKQSFEDIPLRYSHVAATKRRNKTSYPNKRFPDAWKRPQDAPVPRSDAYTKLVEEYVKLPKL